MSEKLGQDPAFPSSDVDLLTGIIKQNKNPEGMSKRFYAACAAMQGLLANELYMKGATKYSIETGLHLIPEIIKNAYSCADELLKQEQDGKE